MLSTGKGTNIKKKLSRKELRKEKKQEKKQRKVNFYLKKKEFRNKCKKDEQPGKFVRVHKDSEKPFDRKTETKPIKELGNEKLQGNIQEDYELEKKKINKLEKEMRKQRIRALNKENEKEDKTIKQLEKKLKLHKRKSKTVPKSFVDCGLDYILDVCESENIEAAVNAEMTLKDSDSEYEEDLALITGKQTKATKNKTRTNNKERNEDDDLEDSEEEEDEDDDEEDDFEETMSDSHWPEDEDSSEIDYPQNNIFSPKKIFDDEIKNKFKDVDSSKKKNSTSTNKRVNFLLENSQKPEINMDSKKNLTEKGILKNKVYIEEDVEGNFENESSKQKKNRKRYLNETIVQEKCSTKKTRLESDSESLNDASDSDAENEGEDDEFWEDIYGRTRDKAGNIIQEAKGKYVPPHLRAKSDAEDSKRKEELEKIKKQLKGLLNRLTENNIHSISIQIDEMYMKNSRNSMNETMLSLYMDSLITYVHTPERLIMEHAMLVAILQANVGTEVGAFFLQNLVKKFDELHSDGQEIENKKLDNVLLLLSHLYTFKVYNSELLYDILKRLCDSFKPKDVDLILVVLRSVGFTLRKDDPIALKQLILQVQKLANEATGMKDDARVKFMLDVLLGIKNNNMKKLPGYDPSHAEHLKKNIKAMFRKGNYVTELKISLEDILKADERGRWWIVGSAWTGPAPNVSDNKSLKSLPAFSQEVLELARKQRMNTSNRKTIFCILMTAEDYLDAFEKLLRLGLKGQPEQEIVHVLLHCLLNENSYNPYYALVAEQLCQSDRRHQMTIQFSVWDRFKELKALKKNQITNLAKFLAHLFLQKSLPISVLKVVEFVELDKSGVRLIRQVLMSILLHEDKNSMIEVFTRIAKPAKLIQLRQSLALFLHHFILRNKSIDQKASQEEKILQDRVGEVIKVLNCFGLVT